MRLWQLYAITILGVVLLLVGARMLFAPTNPEVMALCAANPADPIIQGHCANLR